MEIKEYNLPDTEVIKEDLPGYRFLVWKPDFLCLVLGYGNKIESSIHVKAVKEDNISVYRRPTGGETVLLSPDTLALSVVKFREHLRFGNRFFRYFNEKIIKALNSIGIESLLQKGFSDISINDKKVLGSAIYQNRNKILFQAVLNLNEPAQLMERYIKHPGREPDYRRGRKHMDFVTSIRECGYNHSFKTIKDALEVEFFSSEPAF